MSGRLFRGGEVLLDGVVTRADVLLEAGRIADIGDAITPPDDTEMVDCAGVVLSPGFIDLQCNGARGVDLTTEPERISDVAAALPQFGVTAFLPTIVTAPPTTRRAAIEALGVEHHGDTAGRSVALGLHFEGPAISRDHLGAHVGAHAGVPDDDELVEWIDSGAVRLVTLAPEVDGALAMVRQLADAGIVVAAGHTGMAHDDFSEARRAGLRSVTHLYNAMAPFSHRAPGPIGAVLADDSVVVGMICDGIHVDPVAIRLAWRTLGPSRTSLVSDASAALGAPFGQFRLGEFDVAHDASGVRTADGVLAGSALALDAAVRNLMAFTGCDLAAALATVTSTPADLLGLTDRGRLAVGAHADLTLLEPDGTLRATVIGGEFAWRS